MKKGKNKMKYKLARISDVESEVRITSDKHVDDIKKELEKRYKGIDIDNKIDS